MIKDEIFGTWCVIPSPEVTSIICKAGFDFVIFDIEHGQHHLLLTIPLIVSC